MRNYIEIYGPPVLKAVRALDKLAIDMPQACIMNTIIVADTELFFDPSAEDVSEYFSPLGGSRITDERCGKIISKSGEMLGEYDFFFEWFKDPSRSELEELIEKVDQVLAPLGCKYKITTKR